MTKIKGLMAMYGRMETSKLIATYLNQDLTTQGRGNYQTVGNIIVYVLKSRGINKDKLVLSLVRRYSSKVLKVSNNA